MLWTFFLTSPCALDKVRRVATTNQKPRRLYEHDPFGRDVTSGRFRRRHVTYKTAKFTSYHHDVEPSELVNHIDQTEGVGTGVMVLSGGGNRVVTIRHVYRGRIRWKIFKIIIIIIVVVTMVSPKYLERSLLDHLTDYGNQVVASKIETNSGQGIEDHGECVLLYFRNRNYQTLFGVPKLLSYKKKMCSIPFCTTIAYCINLCSDFC